MAARLNLLNFQPVATRDGGRVEEPVVVWPIR